MKLVLSFLLLFSFVSFSQNTDYNTKKGFAANGYDVVSYFNNKPMEGNKTFAATYDGIRYKFANQENLMAFNKNPENYLPQYGGYCAYAVGEKAEKVSINPETFEIKDGKLYLFYNAFGVNTLKMWKNANTEDLREKANEHWEKIKLKK